MEKITAKQLIITILLIAFLLRLPEFFITLSYDEIWTFVNFAQLPAGKLLFDLSLPNNHPLNSLSIKLITYIFQDQEFIRLPNFLAGLGSVLLAGSLGKRLAGTAGACWSMFFTAVNAPMIVYSMQARGYMLQIFFLLLFACCLAISAEKKDGKKLRFLPEAGVIIAANLAVLSLSTSVLYLAGITLILWNFYHWKLPQRSTIIALIIAGISVLCYILINLQALQSARIWGEAITSAKEYFCYTTSILYQIIPGLVLLPGLWYLVRNRQYLWGYGILLLLLFGSALLTNGGPARVYLPLSCLFCITAGAGMALIEQQLTAKRSRQVLLSGIVFAASAYFYQMPMWRFTNYFPLLYSLEKIPAETLVVFPAGEGYSVLFNSNGEAARFYLRTMNNSANLKDLLIVKSMHQINGTDRQYNERVLPLELKLPTGKIANIPVQRVRLEKCTAVPDGNRAVLILFNSKHSSVFRNFQELLYASAEASEKILVLNNWLNGYRTEHSEPVFAVVWYAAGDSLKPEAWQKIIDVYGNSTSLYYLSED